MQACRTPVQPVRGGIVIVPRRLSIGKVVRMVRGKGGILDKSTPGPMSKDNQVTEIRFESFYRVVLVYTLWNDNRLIAEKVVQAIPGIGKPNAERCVKVAKAHGSSILLTTTRDQAEACVTRLGMFGLKAFTDEA